MQVSPEDAFSCLSKWSEEQTLVSAMLRIGESVAMVKALLSIMPPTEVQIIGIFDGEACPASIKFDFTGATFSYDDWRAAPLDKREYAKNVLESLISVTLPNGGACIIYATED